MPGGLTNGNHQTSTVPEGSTSRTDAETVSSGSSPEAEGADPPLSPCVMTVIVQPPTDVRPGEQFGTPVVVSLESRSSGNRAHDIPGNDNKYWALASITLQDGSNIVEGATAVTIRRASTPLPHQNMGYLIFNNLRIRRPGTFKIYISLVLMPTIVGPQEFRANLVHAFKMDSVLTNEIFVDEDNVTRPTRKSPTRNRVIDQC